MKKATIFETRDMYGQEMLTFDDTGSKVAVVELPEGYELMEDTCNMLHAYGPDGIFGPMRDERRGGFGLQCMSGAYAPGQVIHHTRLAKRARRG